ncbi:hypothetical protein JOF41_007362 [Saccharothrix coeruleofusca]|uniref:hypothetical protein n=1 Tax=Saccharothrix coeruleofusca TaxID=33919 RepID=UPI001AE3AB48|nr:hypothetical protein [Saccharothrix coeruleofusca]MBP2341108.1 hypothetical protein [Saccharothrix coeruleofusca]
MAEGIQFNGTNTSAVTGLVTEHDGTVTPLPEMAGRPPALLISHPGGHLIAYPSDYLIWDEQLTLYSPMQVWTVYQLPVNDDGTPADLAQVNEYTRL